MGGIWRRVWSEKAVRNPEIEESEKALISKIEYSPTVHMLVRMAKKWNVEETFCSGNKLGPDESPGVGDEQEEWVKGRC